MPLATLSTVRFGDVLVLAIAGEIDRSNRSELSENILELVPREGDGLVIDLSATRYLDSAGLDLLFELQRRLHQRGKRLSLYVPDTALVRRTITVTGANKLIGCAGTLPAAVSLAQSNTTA